MPPPTSPTPFHVRRFNAQIQRQERDKSQRLRRQREEQQQRRHEEIRAAALAGGNLGVGDADAQFGINDPRDESLPTSPEEADFRSRRSSLAPEVTPLSTVRDETLDPSRSVHTLPPQTSEGPSIPRSHQTPAPLAEELRVVREEVQHLKRRQTAYHDEVETLHQKLDRAEREYQAAVTAATAERDGLRRQVDELTGLLDNVRGQRERLREEIRAGEERERDLEEKVREEGERREEDRERNLEYQRMALELQRGIWETRRAREEHSRAEERLRERDRQREELERKARENRRLQRRLDKAKERLMPTEIEYRSASVRGLAMWSR
ncbi:MAG: hypothetical protein M1817_004142 [Caeruleum heppii]|nr:MAG: hypothetical protein M1817_004142 [Caeruleum heppii]